MLKKLQILVVLIVAACTPIHSSDPLLMELARLRTQIEINNTCAARSEVQYYGKHVVNYYKITADYIGDELEILVGQLLSIESPSETYCQLKYKQILVAIDDLAKIELARRR